MDYSVIFLTLLFNGQALLGDSLGTDTDPCDTTTRLRFMPYRSSQIRLTPDPEQFSICDQRLDYREGWWYLPADESNNLYDITTQCPGLLTCSSMYPIYYKGSIPRVEDGVVETSACQLGNDGCDVCTAVGIKIKNCGRYRVYFLPRVSGCLHAYCFEPTNSSLISTTDKTTSTIHQGTESLSTTDKTTSTIHQGTESLSTTDKTTSTIHQGTESLSTTDKTTSTIHQGTDSLSTTDKTSSTIHQGTDSLSTTDKTTSTIHQGTGSLTTTDKTSSTIHQGTDSLTTTDKTSSTIHQGTDSLTTTDKTSSTIQQGTDSLTTGPSTVASTVTIRTTPKETTEPEPDPCDTTTPLRYMALRSPQHELTPDPDQFSICDQRLDYREGWWYLPVDGSNNLYDITTKCPGLLTCSSMYPIYYNGSIPRVEDGVVETWACQLGNEGCRACTGVRIKIKNCGSYRVYFLPRASGCSHAYCFELSNKAPYTSPATTITTRVTTSRPTVTTTEKAAKPDTTTIPPDTGDELSTAVLAAIVGASFLFFAGTVILCVLFICRWRKRENPPMYEEAIKDSPTHIYDEITNTRNIKRGPLGIDNTGYETNGSLNIYDEIPEKTGYKTNGSLNIYDEIPEKTGYSHPIDKPHIVQNKGEGNPDYLHAFLANNTSVGSRNFPPTQFWNMESGVERHSSEYDEAFMNENALNEERLSKESTTS